VGSYNEGLTSDGGDNTITNSGTVDGSITGSYNEGFRGGDNTITNSGTIKGSVVGSYNEGFLSDGGGNTITNSGTIKGSVVGSYNVGQYRRGGGNTINLMASSYVGRDVHGTYGGRKTSSDILNMSGGAEVGGNVGGFDVFNKRGPGKSVIRGNLNLGGADVHVAMHEFETQVQVDGGVTGATGNLTVDVVADVHQFEHGKTVSVFSVGEIDTWNSETINESFAEWDLVLLNGQITANFLGKGHGALDNQPSAQGIAPIVLGYSSIHYIRMMANRLQRYLLLVIVNKFVAGLSSGDTDDAQRWGAWTDGTLTWLSNSSNLAKFHGTTYASVAGVDYLFSERLVGGLAIGNDQTWMTTSFNDGGMTSSGFVAMPYLGILLLDNLLLDVSGAVGLVFNRQERDKSTFDYDSSYESVRTMLGSNLTYYHIWNNWIFNVGGGFMYANEYAPSYTERGEPNLRNKVRSSDVYVGQFNVTGGVKYHFEYFTPYASATYLVSPWMTRTNYSNDRDELELALGVDIEPADSFTLSLQVSKTFLRNYIDSNNVMFSLQYQF
jgi:hypothetical protein